MPTSELVTRSDTDAVVTLTFNRPDALNALSPGLFAELRQHIEELEVARDVSCVLVRGSGRSFSAGNDLKALQAGERPPYWEYQAETIDMLAALPQPVVAVVHGHCYTGALELALACDFIVCAASARFADTHARWGMVPSWGMGQRLPRRVGAARARELMFTGRVVDGQEAAAIGLAIACVPDDSLADFVNELTGAICAGSLHSHTANKAMVARSEAMPLEDALAYDRAHHPGPSPDMHERLRASWKS